MNQPCPFCGGEGELSVHDYPEIDGRAAARIVNEVAVEHRVQVVEMAEDNRSAPVVRARCQAMRRIREELRLGVVEIGAIFKRNHSTVLHHLNGKCTHG